MVDEYQDTNTAQFRLIELLASGVNEEGNKDYNLCVVGDMTSPFISSGANIENILTLKGISSARTIKLEQIIGQSILNVANEVIKNNQNVKKRFWTDNEEGHPVSFTQYDNGYEEADGITSEISRWLEIRASYNDLSYTRTNESDFLREVNYEKYTISNYWRTTSTLGRVRILSPTLKLLIMAG